ncbi:MAG: hypothetical protein WD766_06675 [Gemmatimonadota bacterium]
MGIDPTIDDAQENRLNELYWNSSRTIDEIVDELGVGRNTLYSSIEPLRTEISCPTCAGVVVFTNRTNRASGNGACFSCGIETIVPEGSPSEARSNGGRPGEMDGSGVFGRWRDDLDSVAPERAVLIGGAAALGLILGAVAVKTLRH